jgi:hypothetical protein
MEKLSSEVQILSRCYSPLRRRQNKWKHRGSLSDFNLLQINQDFYSLQDLNQRKSLKRSPRLFTEIQKLWHSLNPFSIAGLSKAVFSHFLRFVYKQLFKMHLSDFIFEDYIQKDIELDFKGDTCLFFSDFYESIFDIVDQSTSGKSVSEYVSCVSHLSSALKYSESLTMLNLNSKAHCIGRKAKYLLWMKDFLQVRVEDPEELRSLPRIQSTKAQLDKTSPLSSKKRSGMMKSFLLEEIIEGRNKFLSAYREEKRKIKAKELLQKITN